jgi:DNA-binding winged helix-turn-helix (wHTH) protein
MSTPDKHSVLHRRMPTFITSGNPPARPDFVRVRFDEFELDEANARLLRRGQPIALEPTPFAVLCALVRQSGTLLSNDALLDVVWGHRFVSKSVLKTAIGKLRMAFADDARQPRYIETVSRRGYRFISVASAIPPVQSTGVSVSLAGTLQPPSITDRVDALARLRAAWDVACTGTRMIVWVAGDLGIGKTTVIDHFVASLGNLASAHGQCVGQYGAGEPYLPILEALAELCRKDSTVAPLLRTVAPTWLLQLPWLVTPKERDALQRELAGVRQDRMLREMAELFDRYTEERPLLLVTEDLHWSDHATIQLMDHIARRRGKGRLMWLASFRPTEIILHDHPFKAVRNELRLHGLCEEIVLDPFSEEEVAEYVAQRAPSFAASEGFVRALHERTDGLPMLVNHFMNDLIARGTLGGDEASALLRLGKIPIPENLAGITDQYVARPANEQRVVPEGGRLWLRVSGRHRRGRARARRRPPSQ